MSELREECYKCLNNSRCIGEYRSMYCLLNRRYDFRNIDYAEEKDITATNSFINMLAIENKIDKLEKQYKEALEENSTKAFILKCQIEGFKDFKKELLNN